MKKKILAYVLVVTGFIPVALFVLLKILGRTDILDHTSFRIEISNQSLYNFITSNAVGIIITGFFVGLLMIVIGTMILKKEKMSERVSREVKSLDDGERLIFTQKNMNSIVVITNKRVRYYGFYTRELKRSVRNVPDSDREDYLISDIKSVKPVNYPDVAMSKWAGKNGFGIQVLLKSGQIFNIPVSEQETVASQIDNQIKMP